MDDFISISQEASTRARPLKTLFSWKSQITSNFEAEKMELELTLI